MSAVKHLPVKPVVVTGAIILEATKHIDPLLISLGDPICPKN